MIRYSVLFLLVGCGPAFSVPGPQEISDAGSEAEAEPAPAACTAFASVGKSGATCSGSYAIPAYFAVATTLGTCQEKVLTPDACQCAETYKCACIRLANPCGTAQFVSCTDNTTSVPSEEVTITCD